MPIPRAGLLAIANRPGGNRIRAALAPATPAPRHKAAI